MKWWATQATASGSPCNSLNPSAATRASGTESSSKGLGARGAHLLQHGLDLRIQGHLVSSGLREIRRYITNSCATCSALDPSAAVGPADRSLRTTFMSGNAPASAGPLKVFTP